MPGRLISPPDCVAMRGQLQRAVAANGTQAGVCQLGVDPAPLLYRTPLSAQLSALPSSAIGRRPTARLGAARKSPSGSTSSPERPSRISSLRATGSSWPPSTCGSTACSGRWVWSGTRAPAVGLHWPVATPTDALEVRRVPDSLLGRPTKWRATLQRPHVCCTHAATCRKPVLT